MAAESGPWADAFEPLSESELADVAALFRGLVGMPKLVAGKRLAASFGCRGCHKIYGVGGDKGPDLTSLRSRVRDTDAVPSRSLSLWLKEHFVSPNTAVPGSEMPNLGITPEQAELLTLYVLSLSPRPIPEPLIPNDRILGLHLGQRDFPPDGGSLFRAFCVGCHGSGGEGRRFGVRIATYPALANQDFLAIASDEFLRKSIEKGRPGRGMPAWLSEHSGLRRDEIDAIVAYVRGFQTKAPTFHEVMAQVPEAELGARVFDEQCAACHGADAEGTVLAPPLSASDNPVARNANAVYGTLTVGIAGTAMGSFRTLSPLEMKAVIDWVGRLPPTEPTRGHWRSQPGESERGRIAYGKYCVACHGGAGEGGLGPQLANAGLAEVANDGYLVATLVRGRRGALMPGFGHPTSSDLPMLSPVEIADLVAFLRSLAAQKR